MTQIIEAMQQTIAFENELIQKFPPDGQAGTLAKEEAAP